MRRVKLTFIATIPEAETDDQAYLIADRQVAELDPPGDWVFEDLKIFTPPTRWALDPNPAQHSLADYDPDTGQLIEPS